MAGNQSSPPLPTTVDTSTQRSRFSFGGAVPRRPSQQPVQRPSQQPVQRPSATPQTSSASISSSHSSSTQNVKAVSSGSGVNNNGFGKTSGWYHGSNYDTSDMWKAATTRDIETLKRCLKAGLNVNHCRWIKGEKRIGSGARTIADVVASNNDTRAMRLLLEQGVDLSGTTAATFVATKGPRGQFEVVFQGDERKRVEKDPWTTPLHQACRYAYVDLIQILLDGGHVDVNTRDSQGRTALHMAVIGKSVDAAKLLIARGAVVEVIENSSITPLAAAAMAGQIELVQLFIDSGAILDTADNRHETALYNAMLGDYLEVVTALVAHGANADMKNVDGTTAFFKAASGLKISMMNTLTDSGADTDARDNNGCTALLRAVMARNVPLMRHLLQLGVDIDAEDNDGWTSLFSAMIHKHEEILGPLLTYGCDVWKVDKHGNNALHQAAMLGSTFVIRHVLAAHGRISVNLNQTNHYGETPLALACKHNKSPVVKVLLKHGAQPHHIDPNGHRALDRAMYWGSHACIRLLAEAGAVIDDKAVLALRQGQQDNPGVGFHDLIAKHLGSQAPMLASSNAMSSSSLRSLFARTINIDELQARMREKQAKPPVDPKPISAKPAKDKKEDEEEPVSPDPFEACMPKPPPSQVVNYSTLNIKAGGPNALDVAATGTSIALGITNTVLNNI